MSEKKCCGCKTFKVLEAFANTSCRADGKQDYCKECQSNKRKAYRANLKCRGDVVTPGSKWCPACSTLKSSTEFWTSISKTSGLQDYCKQCQSGITQEYIRTHPEQQIHNKAYRERNPEKVKDWERQAKVKRRRLLENAEYEVGITLNGLYERDKGICGICKLPCERKDASLDHIMPLSKGGDHTWKNSQLAHLRCNSKKRDKISDCH